MIKIYSKVDPSILLASVLRGEELTDYRADLSPEEEYLQVSGRKLNKGIKVKAHKHLPIERTTDITQESWVVVSGMVQGTFYDLDDSFIYQTALRSGDCAVLFKGGHSLEALEDETLFYEFKNGPYYGFESDKEFIR
jgi:hypothetical protein|tara:strand:+ start:982 stop:1392 length:411 start_codon:yes stop_codon:yes gene_type:complete